MDLRGTGVDPAALEQYLQEQIYTLPGTHRPQERFTVLLTGSRSSGTHAPNSDVDIDVLCSNKVHNRVIQESLQAGLIPAPAAWFVLRDEHWDRYFGRDCGRPHFSLLPLERVQRDIRRYEDVQLWVWTHARVLRDPHGQFERIRSDFSGYPRGVLVRKIKYRWLLAAYWEVDCFPCNSQRSDDVLAAASAVLSAVNELLRLCFLAEGKPFPYTEKLMHLVGTTALGRRIGPTLRQVVGLVTGDACDEPAWDRLRRAAEIIASSDKSPLCRELEAACGQAMVQAGVEPSWVEADYDNIEELFSGKLGPLLQ